MNGSPGVSAGGSDRSAETVAANANISHPRTERAGRGIAEADSITLSPWTPYNDRMSQALLAAEIVATEGKSLTEILGELWTGMTLDLLRQRAEL